MMVLIVRNEETRENKNNRLKKRTSKEVIL